MEYTTHPTLLLLQGLPASGKSTYAKQLVADDKRWVRINRDELRSMMFDNKHWTGRQEALTIDVQTAIALTAVAKRQNIIIDDTNLNPRTVDKWKTFAKYHNYNYCQEMLFLSVPVQECIERDAQRSKPVVSDVIKNMAFQYGLLKQEKPFIIVDLDGTLADISARKAKSVLSNGETNWDEMFNPDNISLDVPRFDIMQQIEAFLVDNPGTEVIITSGRSDRTREDTRYWLTKHGFLYNRLLMRPNGDYTPDDVLKEKFLNTYMDKTKCIGVWDDRKKVVLMWRRNGLIVNVCGDLPDGSDF